MGKKRKKKTVSLSGKPFVSVCTPTYNRRKFIPSCIQCFKDQTYPMELIEWIVIFPPPPLMNASKVMLSR